MACVPHDTVSQECNSVLTVPKLKSVYCTSKGYIGRRGMLNSRTTSCTAVQIVKTQASIVRQGCPTCVSMLGSVKSASLSGVTVSCS